MGNFLSRRRRVSLLVWLIIVIVEAKFRGKLVGTKVLRVVKVLSMDVVMVYDQGRLSRP